MKQFKLFFACALMSLFSLGQVWATDYEVVYTLDGTITTGGNSNYAQDGAGLTQGSIDWSVTGNTTINPWRIGGKNLDDEDRLIYSKTAISDDIVKIEIEHGTITLTSVNSLTVEVATDDAFTDIISTLTPTCTANTTATIEHPSADDSWENCYYRFTYNVDAGGSNSYVQVKSIKFYKEKSATAPDLSASPTEIDFGTVDVGASVADQTVEVTFANLTGSVTYSGLSDPFSASGAISATGDEITISADATNAGTFQQTLTIQSAADSKSVEVTVKMKVAAPTGTFELFTEGLVEGDYVICSGTTALKNELASNTNYIGYETVTVSENKITNPSDALIWHIAQSGEYWTLYNAAADNYAASTGAKNKGQVIADGTDDKALWTASGTSPYEFVNKANTAASVNSNLRYNSGYGFACYGTGTGSALTLYKLSNGKEAAGLAYDAADAQKLVKVGGTLVAPTLTNPNSLAVTYASNNTSIAEVNETTGAVTIKSAAGVAVITASTVGDATHNPGSASYTIFVAEQAGTESDPLSEANAKTLIDNGCTLTAHVNGVVATATYNSTYRNYTVTLTGGLQFFRLKDLGNADFLSDYLGVGDEVTAVGQLTKYNTTYELAEGCYLTSYIAGSTAVTGITLTESTAEVEVGSTVALHASVEPISATNKTIVWTVESGDTYASVADGVVTGLAAGTAVIRAASDEDASIYDECTVTVTAADPTKHVVTFDATVDKTADESDVTLTKSNVTIAMTEGTGRFNNGTDYRPWKSSVFTVSCSAGNITKIEFTCTSSKPISGFENPEVGNLEKDGNNGVWTGNAASVSFTASNAQVQITTLTITYQEDSRAEAGLAWDPSDDIELTVGDAFTAPTLLNPNSIDAAEITIESSNPSVATVTAGVVALVADATGTTTITATFAGNASYKPATISYDITVNAAAPILTDYYEKVTSTANIVEGTYLIVYEEGNLAFDGGLATLDAVSNTIAVAITTDDKIGVTPATEAATFYIDPAAGTIKSASDHYIGVSSWSNGLKQTDTYVHNVLEIDGDGNAQIGIYNAGWNTTGGTMLLQYNKSVGQTRFRYYKNGGQQPIALYKLHDEVIKPAAGLAWDPSDDIEITVGDAFTAPTLLNPNSIDAAEITIESSNPSVATVTAGVVELVADATGTTTITATFAGNASYKPATVSYKIKVNPASSIYVSPSLTVNFGSVEKDAALPDDKTITVTLNNVAAATATLGGTNPEAFSIDPATLTASGDITISVVSTATAGSYSATLTISDDASVAASKVVNLSLTVTDPATEEAAISTTSKWVAATNANLVDGAEVLITGVKSDVTYAISEQGSNNRTTDAGSLSEGVFTPGSNTMSFVLEEQATGKYALRTSNGKYLYAASSSANHLKTRDAIGDDGKAVWSISINVDNEASIVANCETANWRNVMQFNQNGGNPPIVACYASASQSVIKLYVPQAVTPTPDYTRTEMLGAGVLGTICVDHNVTSAEGATFYEVSGLNGSQLVLAEVTGELEAGKPYVFQATGNVLNLYYGTTSVADPVNTGALKGTFSATTIENTDPNWANIYYFANHALYSCSDLTSLTLPANRAYLVMSQVGGFSPMPGRRYFTVNVNGKTTPTGMENLENGETPVKMIIDGQLFILRGEKLYDATGRLVK